MKIRYCLIILLLVNRVAAHGQLKHYITMSGVSYANFFTYDLNPVNLSELLPYKYLPIPRLSYKLEKNRIGLEVYMNYYDARKTIPDEITQGVRTSLFYMGFGVNAHYNLWDFDWVKVNPFTGINISWYSSDILVSAPHWIHPQWESEEQDGMVGTQLGLNLNFPIWKGVYASSNLRFTATPWAKYNRANLLAELGVGYMLQRKK